MQYMLIQYVPHDEMAGAAPGGGVKNEPAWKAYTNMLVEAGVMRGGNGLHPPETATTVRLRKGTRDVQDGPFVDSKEGLGGYFVIEVETLDEALDWASKSPAVQNGAVEVRPIYTQ